MTPPLMSRRKYQHKTLVGRLIRFPFGEHTVVEQRGPKMLLRDVDGDRYVVHVGRLSELRDRP